MRATTHPDCPTYESSEFGGASSAFLLDLVRLEERDDIPRAFLHRHSYYHLLWMTKACGKHMLDLDGFDIRDHTVFFVSPGTMHTWTSSVRPQGWVINFSTEFFLQMYPRAGATAHLPFFGIGNETPVLYLNQAQHDALLPLLHAIEAEYLSTQADRFDIVRSYMLILLTRLRRLSMPPVFDGASPQSCRLAAQFKALIERHFLELDAVRDYASRLNVTERQLNEATKRTLGRTAGQLIHARLLLESKRLLINTDLGIAEVAYRLKFEDPAYFCRFFKKQTRLTPGEFKRNYTGPIV